MNVSVLTVTKRQGWEETACEALMRQTFKNFEWVVVSETEPQYEKLNGVHIIPVPAPPRVRLSNLNASLNEGLRYCKGADYVIFYQDFIELNEDCFEKLLDLAAPNTFVTTCTPDYEGNDDKRYTGVDAPRKCRPEEWEANVALAPYKMLKDLGGFEEELDSGWSWDNVHLALRAAMLGAKFILDESNRPKLLPHEQTSKLDMPLNLDRCTKDIKLIRAGKKPVKLNYL